MPIADLQRRMREIGRLRMGITARPKGGRPHPEKLDTFRLTSKTRAYVQAAAVAYGGQVTTWESPRGPEAELIIASPFLDVIVPPGEAVDPWMELWAAGGCQRRCDGVTEKLSGRPCMCPADVDVRRELAQKGEACKPTTRLNVMLPLLPDIGVWRLESHGYYAALELAGTVDTLHYAMANGILVRARLRIDHRSVKRPDEPRHDFIVPVLELPDIRMLDLVGSGALIGGPGSAIAAGDRLALPAPASRPPLGDPPALPADPRLATPPAQAAVADPPPARSFEPAVMEPVAPELVDVAAPDGKGLAIDDFRELLRGARIPIPQAQLESVRRFGTSDLEQLPPTQRMALWKTLEPRMDR